jgi:hypothetical protein
VLALLGLLLGVIAVLLLLIFLNGVLKELCLLGKQCHLLVLLALYLNQPSLQVLYRRVLSGYLATVFIQLSLVL